MLFDNKWQRKVPPTPSGHSPPSQIEAPEKAAVGSRHSSFFSSFLPCLSPFWHSSVLRGGNLHFPRLSSFRVSNQAEWQPDIFHHHLPHRSPRSLSLCPPSPHACKDPPGSPCALFWGSPLKLKHSLTTHDKADSPLPLSATRFQSSVVQWRARHLFSPREAHFYGRKSSEAIRLSPALSAPGLVALLCLPSWAPSSSVTLIKNSGGSAGTLSLFSLSCKEPSTVARKAETPCHRGEVSAGGWGKRSTQTSPPFLLLPVTRYSGPRGSTSVWFPLLHCVRFFCKSFYSYFF